LCFNDDKSKSQQHPGDHDGAVELWQESRERTRLSFLEDLQLYAGRVLGSGSSGNELRVGSEGLRARWGAKKTPTCTRKSADDGSR